MPPDLRSSARRVAMFNHKGGVGKTTLTMNIAAAVANLDNRVLLVDSDPQCNLTSYLISDEVVDDLLDQSDGDSGRTIWSSLKPVSEATGRFRNVQALETSQGSMFLLPGDIRLAEFESDLSEYWGQCLQRKSKGFRGTTAISELVNQLTHEAEIDFVFYDPGPNIGPLNRAILLDCDQFVVPVACDLFSLRALATLGHTLAEWITDWEAISDLAPEELYLLPGQPRFQGYIPGGFRVYGGTIAQRQQTFLSRIEREVDRQIVRPLRQLDSSLAVGTLQSFKLGEVKHFGALIPASQEEGVPLWDVNAGSLEQKQEAKQTFTRIAEKIVNGAR